MTVPRSSQIRELLALADRPDVLSLAGGLPAPEALPVERIRAALSHVTTRRALQYGPTDGAGELRELLAAEHGVPVDEVLITTGSQQGLDLVARAFVERGDRVTLANPGYLGAIQAFEAQGAELIELGVAPPDRIPKLAYVVPNFHNPTGESMSVDARKALARAAEREGFTIVEDDPYGALAFSASSPPPIRSMAERAIYLGTASKTLAPGLRVGWLIAPRDICERCSRIKQAVDLHSPMLNQLIVADVLSDREWYGAHVAALRELYRERARALGDALDTIPLVHRAPVDGGMFTWVDFDGVASTELLAQALARGVAFVPGNAFGLEGAGFERSARLCHATLGPEGLTEAVRRLGSCLLLDGRELAGVVPDSLGAGVAGARRPNGR